VSPRHGGGTVADDDDGDDDWFEAAFEDDGDSEGTAERAAGPVEDASEAERPAGDETSEDEEDAAAAPADDGASGDGDEDDAGAAPDPSEETDADDLAAAFGAGDGPSDDGGETGEDGVGETADDGGGAGSEGTAGGTPDDFADAFDAGNGGGGGGSGAGAGGGGGDDTDLFDDDFADAFAGADGASGGGGPQMPGGGGGAGDGDQFGFDLEGDAGAGDQGGDFEEEDFDSDIPRIDVGIEGLDEMIQGGVPERSLMVAVGEAGTGKTTFGLQFLYEAVQNGERAVFITLEESRERVVQSADEKGWNFSEHAEDGDLAVVDIDPIEMANSLTSIRNELPRLVEEFGASRLVLDSVSLLEMMYDDQSTRRTEIYDFTKALKEAGVTTMLTSEASEDNAFASRYGVIEYLTDAVVVLRYIRPEDFRETRLAVEIQKIRDANHSRETKPYEITHQGISVYRQANIF